MERYKRKIITIHEDKCNGCGLCVTACHEGAIQMVDGKARLISEQYCDGLGDCLPACPMDAIEMDEEKMKAAADASASGEANFETMTLVQQIKAVDAVIDENVRQFLIMDGGDMEVIDIKKGDENIDIYIRYLGACNGCASSSTGTLYAIESTLKEKLSKSIRVLPI